MMSPQEARPENRKLCREYRICSIDPGKSVTKWTARGKIPL
jgi:hypothetical protein